MRSSSARRAAWNSRSRSPFCSASTRQSAPARAAGFGNTIDFDLDRVIPTNRFLDDGVVSIHGQAQVRSWLGQFSQVRPRQGAPFARPFADLTGEDASWCTISSRRFFAHWKPRNTAARARLPQPLPRAYAFGPGARAPLAAKRRCSARRRPQPGRRVAPQYRGAAQFFDTLALSRKKAPSPRRFLVEIRQAADSSCTTCWSRVPALDRLSSTLSAAKPSASSRHLPGFAFGGHAYVLDEPSIGPA